jgi:DNA primase catalytic core
VYVTKEAIEKVRRGSDLVKVVESRGVKLTRKGKNWVGLCPFHEDHTPSLVVNPDRQLWNCFGACKAIGAKTGGDVFTFVAQADRVSFLEALKRLGYEEPAPAVSKNRAARRRPSSRAEASPAEEPPAREPIRPAASNPRELLARVAGYYHRVLRDSAVGQEYLAGRGLTDAGMLEAFEVGYADGSLLRTLDEKGDVATALKQIGVLTGRGRELMAGCVVLPLTLPDAGVVGLYGRHVKQDQHLYLPGPRRGLINWQAMKASPEIIFTESAIDALSLYQLGIRNVSAVYGTQGFTPDHEELLARFRVQRVTLLLDADEAGRQAARVVGERIERLGIEASIARLAGAKDPNELLTKLGAEAAGAALREAIAETSPLSVKGTPKEKDSPVPTASLPALLVPAGLPAARLSEPPAPQRGAEEPGGPKMTREEGGGWQVAFPSRSYRVRGLTATGLDRLRVNLRVECNGRTHLDTLDLYGHRARAALVKQLACVFECEEEDLARELSSLIETLEGLRLKLAVNNEPPRGGRVEMPDAERDEALRLLRSPDLMQKILTDFEAAGCVGEKTTLTVGYLGTVSRLLEEPLGLMIVSRSGAGKSSVQDLLCDVVPEEDLVRYTRLTGQALFYKAEDSLAHKVLAIDEEQGAAEAAYSIRNLQSAQVLTVAATRADPATGKLTTEEYRVKGPVFIMFTTTSPEALDYETRNRFVQVGIDESTEQTRRILARQREADTLEGVLARERSGRIVRVHQNAQRLLRPLKVVNPYATALSYGDERLQMRREQKKYLTLIKAVALLHQHQREIKRARSGDVEVEYVEVEPSDIELANDLARQVLGQSLDELAHPTRLLLAHLVEMTGRGDPPRLFTRRDVREHTGWTDWQLRVHLAQLLELEYVVVASGRMGKRMTYELLFDGDAEKDARYVAGLVDVEALGAAMVTGGNGAGGGVPRADRTIGHLVSRETTL